MTPRQRIAVIGGGWAGLAAAVRLCQAGHAVVLHEMARRPGGRARAVDTPAGVLDNGQHILIGAYTRTLALMRDVGADPSRLFERRALSLTDPDGRGLRLPPGPPIAAFVRGVLSTRSWRPRDRWALLAAAAGWGLRGFRCAPKLTVQSLCRTLPEAVLRELIEPLCVAALNTPSAGASAAVFLRVLKDALFSGPGSADLLLPRRSLGELLPDPAQAWLAEQGARIRLGHRVMILERDAAGWRVDGDLADAVVLACSSSEAARLTERIAPAWSATAGRFQHEPIVTVYLREPQLRLAQPMLALPAGPEAPAQFVFDLGALGMAPGLFAFVVSGASGWLARGREATAVAALAQARHGFPGRFMAPDAEVVAHVAAERRATFSCTPDLERPAIEVAPRLVAAGDYIEGPYPSTLEGAVRSGEAAAQRLSG